MKETNRPHLALSVACALWFALVSPAQAAPISLSVDATGAPRKILRARLRIPAQPGALTLVYPKWIPGEHGPTGPIADLTGLVMTATGKPVVWRRDAADMFAFHLDVPAGAEAVDVALGLNIKEDGQIADVIPGSPADQAGVAPAMRLVAVNGRRWTPAILRAAVKSAKSTTAPIELLVENADYFKTCALDYHGGEKYPQLERDAAKPDLLSEILKPLAPAPANPNAK